MEVIHKIGRRKTSVARAYLSKGKGVYSINGKSLEEYFPTALLQYKIKIDQNLGEYSIITALVDTDQGQIEILYDEGYRGNDALNESVNMLIQNLGLSGLILRSLISLKNKLGKIHHNCFYCKKKLQRGRSTHLEHVIPFDYIAEDNIWNFALACQKCNCKKLGALPTEYFLRKLIKNITSDRNKISKLDDSLKELGDDFAQVIENHYRNAKKLGYATKDMS